MIILLSTSALFFVLACIILISCSFFMSRKLSSSGTWASPYECGFIPSSFSFDSFSFTYFSLLIFFVVFDLEISLLLNMPEQSAVWGGFIFYFIFLLILACGFFIEAMCGYVRWGH
uniref:NADH-ubiquinone oxidoreductase chain 3 n=1 Tax=Khawia sinensis TaxID=125900 RepID=A0A1W5J6L5_9CEST|nr:NADH dehydrogenase subunit 3 [Khawia sinensis]ALK26535.1 NADH dehydrogenase subunit 3 [Khawia sinensis]